MQTRSDVNQFFDFPPDRTSSTHVPVRPLRLAEAFKFVRQRPSAERDRLGANNQREWSIFCLYFDIISDKGMLVHKAHTYSER